MTEDEKTYVKWFEGRTFRNVDSNANIIYRLGELHGRGTIHIHWYSPRSKLIERINFSVAQLLRNIKRGAWELRD